MTSRSRVCYGAAFLTFAWTVLLLLTVLIWLESLVFGVVFAVCSLFLAWDWYCTIWAYRGQVFAAILPKQALLAKTVKGYIVLFYLCILSINIGFLFWFWRHPPLQWLLTTYTAVGISVVLSRPPGILWLTTSSAQTVRLMARLDGCAGVGAVALLDTRKASWFHRTMSVFANYRNINDNVWESVVYPLMDIVPVIVVDTRFPTDGVIKEIKNLFARDLAYKTLFLRNPDETAPALWSVIQDRLNCPVMVTNESDILSHVRYLLMKKGGRESVPDNNDRRTV